MSLKEEMLAKKNWVVYGISDTYGNGAKRLQCCWSK